MFEKTDFKPTELQMKIAEAKQTGILYLEGEMQIPLKSTIHQAYAEMKKIAEACGYIVSKIGSSRLEIHGGYMIGYYVLDWFDSRQEQIQKVEFWTCDSAYTE